MNLHKVPIMTIVPSILAPLCFVIFAASTAASQSGPPLTGKININTATRQQLIMLPGIDRSLSFKIVMHRKRHRLTKIEDILKVEGIDRQVYAKIKPFIVVEGKTTLRPANR